MSFGWHALRPVEFKTNQGDSFWVSRCDIATAMRFSSWGTNRPRTARTTYVKGYVDGVSVYLHRVVMGAPKGMLVDHIDGNGMNCTRGNMRLCSRRENSWNSQKRDASKSGYIGVCWCTTYKKWKAQIRHSGKNIALGYHETYDGKCRDLRGAFAVLNFSEGQSA